MTINVENKMNEQQDALENKRAILKQLIAKKAEKAALAPKLQKHVLDSDKMPLSFAQQRLWNVDQMQQGSIEYNMPIVLRLSGSLDIDALTAALNTVLQRHQILRTVYKVYESQPYQSVLSNVAFQLPIQDLRSQTEDVQQEAVKAIIKSAINTPFNLEKDIMIRGELLHLGDRSHILIIIMHHIAADGWSQGIMTNELSTLYAAYSSDKTNPLSELEFQYADYAKWQKDSLQGEVQEKLRNYWLKTLSDLPVLHSLHTDFPRPAQQSSKGQQLNRSLPLATYTALFSLARQHNVTLFMIMNAALSCLLSRYSGETDIVIGSPVATREQSEIQSLIGCFLNNLVLRTDVSQAETFTQLLQQTRAQILAAYAHQQMPFDVLVEELQPERSLSYHPLFQIMMVLQNNDYGELSLPGLEVNVESIDDNLAKFDLTLEIVESSDGLILNWVYATDLFTDVSIGRLADSFNVILHSIAEQPDLRIPLMPLLNKGEIDYIVNQLNHNRTEYDDASCIHHLFEKQVHLRKDAIAVEFDQTHLTYGELNKKANQLAQHLITLGVRDNTLVGLSVTRSLDMLVGMLGILKAGGAYVALDPANPDERLHYMVENSGINLVVTQREISTKYPNLKCVPLNDIDLISVLESYPEHNQELVSTPGPHSLAYVIYTSGSTGKPKGVMLSHQGAVNLVQCKEPMFEVTPESRVLQFASLGFDAATWECLMALTQGACLYICSDSARLAPEQLSDFLVDKKISHALVPPSLLAHLDFQRDYVFDALIVGGEACDQALAWQWASRYPLYNAYGPSETTVCATIGKVIPQHTLTIGRALNNFSLYVLDQEKQPVPIGVVGELHIGGVGVAKGYVNRPDLTAEKFFNLEIAHRCAERVYKTGDLVRWMPDGSLEFIGRIDDQIKIRGFRIEIGEIESSLTAHDKIKDAVVLAIPGQTQADTQLVAWVVTTKTEDGFIVSSEELLSYAKQRLPHYMVPVAIVLLDALPLTSNGKVDKKALPQPQLINTSIYLPPESEAEQDLAVIWAALLPVKLISKHSNFFSLGGHSLLAAKLIAAIKTKWQIDIGIKAVFSAQTLAEQASIIERWVDKNTGAKQPPILSAGSTESTPLSYSQQRLWLIDQMQPGGSEYNMSVALRLNGRLDSHALERALASIVARHDILRTVYVVQQGEAGSDRSEGSQVQQLLPESRSFTLKHTDLAQHFLSEQETEVAEKVAAEADQPFNLENDLMIRAELLHLSAQQHVLLLTLHHIASDGWSMSLLIKELTVLYRAYTAQKPSPLPSLALQYRDYAIWQREWQNEQRLQNHMIYWKNQLAGIPQIHSLPLDFVRATTQQFKGAQQQQVVNGNILRQLRTLAEQHNATLFMVLHTVFAILLSRYSGEKDIVVGSPVANRDQPEISELIGFFVNTLVLRLDLSDSPSFTQLLSQSRETLLSAWEHQHIPFELLVDVLQPERSLSHNPLFQIMLSYNNISLDELDLGDLHVSPIEREEKTAQFDLTLDINESAHGLVLTWEYSTDLFLAETIQRMTLHFNQLLSAVVQSPDVAVATLDFLTEQDKFLLRSWSNAEAGNHSCAESLEHQIHVKAIQTPDAIGVVWQDASLTYRELDEQASRLANVLIQRGVKENVLVGLCFPRGLDLIVAMLAVFKSGGGYLPLDPDYPSARLEHMINDSSVGLILSLDAQAQYIPASQAVLLRLDDAEMQALIASQAHSITEQNRTQSGLAYVIYTSGSTGLPKGVKIGRQAAANHIKTMVESYRVSAEDRCLLAASVNFDAAFEQIFVPLTSGAQLHVLALKQMPVEAFDNYLVEQRITVADLPLSYLTFYLNYRQTQARTAVNSYENQGPTLNLLIVGGEVISKAVVEDCFATQLCSSFVNAYGPTEAVVTSSIFTVTEEQLNKLSSLPIGRACGDRWFYVLDESMRPTPIGVVGELVIGGACLADGYLGQAALTAERFVSDPVTAQPQGKMYRTGDLVRYNCFGLLEFVGRADEQVKLRGFRIELGEIETALIRHPNVKQAVVEVCKSHAGAEQLVAYLVTDHLEPEALQGIMVNWLAKILPEHMIPTIYIPLVEMPQAASGKIDRRALPKVNLEQLIEFEPPVTTTEIKLAGIWQTLLECEKVGRNSNFFALGGHSLLATRLVTHVRDHWNIDVSLKTIFSAQTIALLAPHIDSLVESQICDEVMPVLNVIDQEALSLSFAQQRLWFIDQLEPGGCEYNMPSALKLVGNLNIHALQHALAAIVERHQVLRTVYCQQGEDVYQKVFTEFAFELEMIDISATAAAEQVSVIETLAAQEAQKPFNLNQDLMIRGQLIRLSQARVAGNTSGSDEFILLLTLHHIASDGWSIELLISELGLLYDAFSTDKLNPLTPLKYQYADYAYSQRQWLQGARLKKEMVFWLDYLHELPPVHDLPLDKTRPALQSYEGGQFEHTLTPALSSALASLAKQQSASLFMVLNAAFSLLLSRYSGESDIVLGTPVANREQTVLEPMIGFFVNTLVLRTKVDGQESFYDLLEQCKHNTLQALEHQRLPFEALVEQLQPGRSLSYNPLFQIMLSVENNRHHDIHMNELEITLLDSENTVAQFDLSLNVLETAQGLSLGWEFAKDLFLPATIERMALHFAQLLNEIVSSPQRPLCQVSMLSAEERHQVLNEFNSKTVKYQGEECIHQRFERQVENAPNAIAVVGEQVSLSYAQLNARANQLAHYLRKKGLGPGQLVGIYAHRSPEFLTAILAIMKAGGAYAPLDPVNPLERIRYMLEDSSTTILLTETALLEQLSSQMTLEQEIWLLDGDQGGLTNYSESNPSWCNGSNDLAYMIYTSGSTGQPKGALVHHAGALNHIDAEFDVLGFIDDNGKRLAKNFLQSAASSSDVSVWQFLAPLVCGGQTVILDDMTDTAKLLRLLQHHQVHLIQAAPVVLQLLVDHLAQLPQEQRTLPDLQWMMVIAEAAPVPLINRWLELYPKIPIMNGYGPSEASDDITQYIITEPLPDNTPSIPIGKPLPNLTMYVLDQDLQLQPVGVPGELCVSGVGVGPGYWNKPERTAQSFVLNPYFAQADSEVHGDTIYRTGDLGRWLPDGNLEFMGRLDNQVKVRGFRIELGEVEACLAKLENVGECAVIVRQDPHGQNALAAYLVAKGHDVPTVADLREGLQRSLPSYMIPSSFTILDAMPLNAADKIDRKALPAPDFTAGQTNTAPVGQVETKLAEIWAELLQMEHVGANANFFDCGGHSLLAAKLIARIRAQWSADVAVKSVFEAQTLSSLARIIEKAPRTQAPKIVPAPQMEARPLSFSQQRLWFMQQNNPNSCEYNMPFAYELNGHLNVKAMHDALSQLILRHHVLHSCYEVQDGLPVLVRREHRELALPIVDLSALSSSEQSDAVKQLMEREAETVFDLSKDLMLRAILLCLGEQRHVLLMTLHHVASDGWSENIILSELAQFYQANLEDVAHRLPELPIQYSDYAYWQRTWQHFHLQQHLDYWTEQLADLPPVHNLPLDYARPIDANYKAAQHSYKLDLKLTQQLNLLALEHKASLFMVLNATFATLLSRYSGETDIVIGAPVANRDQHEIAPLIGCFINTVVLRSTVAGDMSFIDLLKQSRERVLLAFEHQHAPFEAIVQKLQPERSFNYNPLFQIMLSLENNADDAAEFTGINIEPIEQQYRYAQFDLSLDIVEDDTGLTMVWDYASDLFAEGTIVRMAEHFAQLINAIANEPEQKLSKLSILTQSERQQILNDFNGRTVNYRGEVCIHQRFETQAHLTPEAIAVVGDNLSLTYQQLNQQANRLAHHLREVGVGKNQLVGIYAHRSPKFLVAMLGIMKAGGAYVPLDPVNPPERIQYMLADSQFNVLLSETELQSTISLNDGMQIFNLDDLDTALRHFSGENPVWCNEASDLAYMIYTSGSTGQPKGALVHHMGALNHIDAEFDVLGFMDGEQRLQAKNFLQSAASSSDVSVWQFLAPLMSGGKTVILDDMKDVPKLLRLLQTHQVNLMQAVPVVLQMLIDCLQALPAVERKLDSLQWMMIIGEASPVPLVNLWLELYPQIPIMNGYGPSEASDDITEYVIRQQMPASAPRIPIGKPLPNLTMYVLDKGMQLQPIGVPGELCVSGVGVGLGYWNKPERTAQSFVANPYFNESNSLVHGQVIYCTGDLGRWLPDGNLEYIGRVDNQVKVRGFRIELGEVETGLAKLPGVGQCAVIVRQDTKGANYLAAYIVSNGTQTPSETELRDGLRQCLPEYMIPTTFTLLSEMPLNGADKIDRKALPSPEFDSTRDEKFIAPQTETEKRVAKIWCELLELERISKNVSFYSCGGHSILIVKLMMIIKREFACDVSVRDIFQADTIESQAGLIDNQVQACGQNLLMSLNEYHQQRHTLYCVPAAGGLALAYLDIAQVASSKFNVKAFDHKGILTDAMPHQSITEMVDDFIDQLREDKPAGPYFIAGHSSGGQVAYEMALKLQSQGEKAIVILLDSFIRPLGEDISSLIHQETKDEHAAAAEIVDMFLNRGKAGVRVDDLNGEQLLTRFLEDKEMTERFIEVSRLHEVLSDQYQATGIAIDDVVLIYAEDELNGRTVKEDLEQLTLAKIYSLTVSGNHNSMLLERGAVDIVDRLSNLLSQKKV